MKRETKQSLQPLPDRPFCIGVARFRTKMKDYLDMIKRKGFIVCTGSHGEANIMSDETLRQLEIRHAFNVWARKAYAYMDLNTIQVLQYGVKTKDLPMEFQYQLRYFFQFIYEICDYAAREVSTSSLANYNISTAVYDAVFDRNTIGRVTFSNSIDMLVNDLYIPEVFKAFEDYQNPDVYVYFPQFLDRLGSVSFDEWHGVQDSRYLKCEELTDEQRIMVSEMIHQFTIWAKLVIWNQPLDTDYTADWAKKARIHYEALKEVYEKYIGEFPPVDFFPL